MRRHLLILCLLGLTTACTGLTLGENKPGGSTHMEYGSIAVDPHTETSFVLETQWVNGIASKTLFAVDPDAGPPQMVANLTGYNDIRIIFPVNQVLIMAEKWGQDVLIPLDAATLQPAPSIQTAGRYNGVRVSPSGRFLAVADNNQYHAPIHIIDTLTWEIHKIPHGGDTLEAMWLNNTDELVAIVFDGVGTTQRSARILSWAMLDVANGGFMAGLSGTWANPILDIGVEDVTMDVLFSFTWVGVSPNDRWAALPVLSVGPNGKYDHHTVIVVDVMTSETRFVEDAPGPVGFTPDSADMVSYRYAGVEQTPQLLLVDTLTLGEEAMDLPMVSGPQFFVSGEGNFVVVASQWGNENLVLYDVDAGAMTTVTGPAVGLGEFVARPSMAELWLADNGLFRLDLLANSLQAMPLTFTPRHLNILPQRDRLVLDDGSSNELRFYDLKSQNVVRTVTLGL